MKNTYSKLLLENLRLLPFKKDDLELTNENLVKAMTLNENIKSYGYTLSATDIVNIARSSSLDVFYDEFVKLIDTVDAKPMYPNFPNQVMEMDEATFRFHQMVHYFSTYGMEALFGVTVQKGWLPNVEDTEKVEDDETLLKAKLITLISDKDMYNVPFTKLLNRKERMTIPEMQIINTSVKKINIAELSSIDIPFKENLLSVSLAVFDADIDNDKKIDILNKLCQHTGDVFRISDYIIGKHKYKLRTSQKKILVKLFQRYSVTDFKANILLSNKKAKRSHIVLNYISFSTYCKDKAYLDVVSEFRNGDLQSWEGKFKSMVAKNADNDDVLNYVAQRPGMMFRMLHWLLKLGMPRAEVKAKMIENIQSISLQTLITTLNYFSMDDDFLELYYKVSEEEKDDKLDMKADKKDFFNFLFELFIEKAKYIEVPFANEKVFIDSGTVSLENSWLDINGKSAEGGYLRSGIAIKIPNDVNKLRFFVYWNDECPNVDIDLHAFMLLHDGLFSEVGYYAHYKSEGVVTSGDITHSDSAEYIDMDLSNKNVKMILPWINVFRGPKKGIKYFHTFKAIDTCYTGMLAVKNTKETVKLYNPKNCFFSHNLQSDCKTIQYAAIDFENRVLKFVGKDVSEGIMDYGTDNRKTLIRNASIKFSIMQYLTEIFKNQGVTLVDKVEDADVVLTVEKQEGDNKVSLIEENFFLDNEIKEKED